MTPLAELKARLLEVDDLQASAALLRWDQQTYMPPRGAAARGRHIATLSRLAHEKVADAVMGRLLDRLERDSASLPPDADDAALVRLARRLFERATRIPPALVAAMNEHWSAISPSRLPAFLYIPS